MTGNNPTLQDFIDVQAHFALPRLPLAEKDWYVIKALAAILGKDTSPLQLVFGGGTALSRAHRLVRRMSEDIDLRITASAPITRSMLQRLREKITTALLEAGFAFDPKNPEHRKSANESRYTVYNLPYNPLARGGAALRPTIKIETSVWPLRHPAIMLPVSSFVAEAFKQPAEIPSVACVSVEETAADKFVALTRRIGAERLHPDKEPDATLVRHLYDLRAIQEKCDPAEVATLASEIMKADAEAYGNQFPAYRKDTLEETRRAIEAIASDTVYRERFASFQADMVFGEPMDFDICLQTLREIEKRIKQ